MSKSKSKVETLPNIISNNTLRHIIHVNKHIVKSNRVLKRNDPVITVKNYKVQHNTYEVNVFWQGHKVCSVVHRPDKPLSCGAVAWVEVPAGVEVEFVPAPKINKNGNNSKTSKRSKDIKNRAHT